METSGRLFESEKLAQAVDEFAKQLKVCAEVCVLGRQQKFIVNVESDALLISFHTHVILHQGCKSIIDYSKLDQKKRLSIIDCHSR